MKINYEDHYDKAYWTAQKTYKTPDGRTHRYHGPALQWDGFNLIADTLTALLPKGSLLDVGCGSGDLALRLWKKGFDSYGVDISEHAIKNRDLDMFDRLAYSDITQTPHNLWAYGANNKLPDTFDILIATDLLEHIYEEDLNHTFDWMLEKTNKWLFFCVATALPNNVPGFDPNKMEFIHKKGEIVPVEWQATAVSGHVNVRRFSYWADFFKKKNLKIDWQRMYIFQIAREMNPGWRETMGWNMQTTFFLEKR